MTTPETPIAYHGNTTLKTALLEQLEWHREQDMITQGIYGGIDPDTDKWHGCAVGCSIHSLNRIHNVDLDPSDHAELARMTGWPEWLCRLEDSIFEGLPLDVALRWPFRVAAAIPVGVDLKPVRHHLGIAIQTRNRDRVTALDIAPELRSQILDAINGIIAYHEIALISGDESVLSVRSAQSAQSAADAAAAAAAAKPAAWSAAWSAARSAARSAESAARSAESAAESAAWAAAESLSAAESAAEWVWISDTLVALLTARIQTTGRRARSAR